ncbi:MAG: nitrite reductase small subunit NirD [Pseudomonadota bacterium]
MVPVGRLDDIVPLSGRCVKTAGGEIGVFRTADNRVFAIENRCPHKGGPLSEGIVHGTSVTCPLHNMVISLSSGAIEGPEEGGVKTIPCEVREGVIFLGLPAQKAA